MEINNNSFRDLAKQLVGLLSNDTFVDISANALHTLCSGYYQLSKTAPLYDDEEDVNHVDVDNNNKNVVHANAHENSSKLAHGTIAHITSNISK